MNPLIFAVIVSKLAQMWMKTLIFVLTVIGGFIVGVWKFALKDAKKWNATGWFRSYGLAL